MPNIRNDNASFKPSDTDLNVARDDARREREFVRQKAICAALVAVTSIQGTVAIAFTVLCMLSPAIAPHTLFLEFGISFLANMLIFMIAIKPICVGSAWLSLKLFYQVRMSVTNGSAAIASIAMFTILGWLYLPVLLF